MENLPFWLVGAVIVIALIAYIRGRSSVHAEHDAAEQEAKDTAAEVQSDVGMMSPEARREEMKRKWRA